MKRNLSYSGYQKYVTCPKMYDYHYNERLRTTIKPSHLVFGSAVDAGINSLLGVTPDVDNAVGHAALVLEELYSESTILKPEDYDGELITEYVEKQLLEELKKTGWQGTNYLSLASALLQNQAIGIPLSDNQKKALRILTFYSLLEKCRLMFQAFIDYVLPQIEETHSIQNKVKRGITDFEATFKGIGRVIVDNKTSARDYEPDAVKTSIQLAGYGAERAMYIVFNKNVRKNRTKACSVCGNNGTGKRHKTCDAEVNKVRCNGEWTETVSPEVIPQILVDDIPTETRAMVEQAYQDVEKLIESKVFPRNLTACGKQFGKPCPYINLCWKGDSTGLVVVPEDEPKEDK